MKFIILGMGSVGSLWAYKLFFAGYDVIGFCRGNNYNTIRNKGLKFVDLDGLESTIKQNYHFKVFSPEIKKDDYWGLINSLDKDDWIIITGKAYSLENIVEDYKELIKSNGSILILQNGIGNEEILHKILPNIIIFRGTTTNGSFLKKPGEVQFTGRGITKFGIPKINKNIKVFNEKKSLKKLKNLIENLAKTSLSVEFSQKIDLILWEKILINIGINAIATIEGITNGDLLKTQGRKNLMKIAITEAWKVGKALKIPLKENPDDYIALTYDVAEMTSNNINSMLQDINKGKPTEIDFINGTIVKYAQKLGIDTPINLYLTNEIKRMEKSDLLK